MSEERESFMKRMLRDFLAREPFDPFVLVMTSGDRFKIENPNLVHVYGEYITYFLPRSDAQAHIRLNQLVFMQSEPGTEIRGE